MKHQMRWNMWAQEIKETFYHISSNKWWVELYGKKHPIVPVLVEESEEGTYYGWLGHGDKEPSMIWPTEPQFSMCFTYGYKAEEKAGKGRRVQLAISHRKQ